MRRLHISLLVTMAVALGTVSGDQFTYTDAPLPVGSAGPVNTAAPKVSGVPSMVTADNTFTCASSCTGSSPTVTGHVSVSNGTWTVGGTMTACGSVGMTCTYQWQDCNDSGNNCTNATGSGATSSTYTLNTNDLGHTLKAVVTASSASGSASASGYTGPGVVQFSRQALDGIFYHQLTPLTTAQEAERYQYILAQYDVGQSALTGLRSGNPGLQITPYLDSALADPTNQANGCTQRSTDVSNAVANPGVAADDWFLHQASVGTLTTGLSRGSAVTRLSVSGAVTMPANTPIEVVSGSHVQEFETSASVSGSTTISVDSQDANFSYPSGTTNVYPPIGYNGSFSGDPNATEMDVGNTSYQQACYAENLALYNGSGGFAGFRTTGWNGGAYWDNVQAGNWVFPAGGAYYSGSNTYPSGEGTAWLTAYENFIANAKTYFAGHGGPNRMMPNIADQTLASSASSANVSAIVTNVLPNTGGMMTQQWLDGGSGTAASSAPQGSSSSALDQLSNALYAAAHNDYFLANTLNGSVPSEAEETYELATLLLAANGKASLSTSDNRNDEQWFPEFNVARELGPATSGLQTRTDSAGHTFYERDFANGVVLSNPSQTPIGSVTPTPGGNYSGVVCSGDAQTCTSVSNASSVTLSPSSNNDDGAILLNHS